MIRWLVYIILACIPLGGFLITYFIVRKFKRERDEARAALRQAADAPSRKIPAEDDGTLAGLMRREDNLVEEAVKARQELWKNSVTKFMQQGAAKTQTQHQIRAAFQQGYADAQRLLEQFAAKSSVMDVGTVKDSYLPGHASGSVPISSMDVNWENLSKALGGKVNESDSDVVYVISPDDFEQFRADLKLHRATNAVLEANEKDGLVTMRLGGITYHIARELFDLVKEFWDYGRDFGAWHR